ncbi:osmotic avoidance abnormal protein 3-like [Centruroides sculpturatus]|uniref:osmotic avoidance abnormal protein 3-like n=1 Tax=Centruroides sculpturatus TaxID=218467 RepID=UPI000C6EEC67|nr:osmotic avoidance abnormal protein 3-like [Centruroides sculpturatus]
MANIKVAVRLRPLDNRENSNEKISVDTKEKTVVVTDFRVPSGQDYDHRQRVHYFKFDYCFWSVDTTSSRYVGQRQIYDQLGKDILKIILDGYNCCLFTYGQSGSGKTYTMLGNADNPGLIPLLTQEIFQPENQRNRLTFRVELSCMDIYNEKVYDLIHPSSDIKNLRIREHPLHGPYIDGLSHQVVKDSHSVTSLIEQIVERRNKSITPSRKNRSHTIFTIKCNQILLDEKGVREINSKLHLVDLAASERPNTQADQNCISATSNINKSLTTLGIVITSLANRESKFVPYRDSVLTWLLKDSLGGNSFTFMLATISPSSAYCSETINTLRYAQRVKSIVNRPIINQTPAKHLLDHLKCEVSHLKEILLHSKQVPETNETISTIEKVSSVQDSLENVNNTECDTAYIPQPDLLKSNLSNQENMSNANMSLSPNFPGLLTSKYLVALKDKINSKQEGNYIYRKIPLGCRKQKRTLKRYSYSDSDINKLGSSPNFKLFQAAICGLSKKNFKWDENNDDKVKIEFRSCTEVHFPSKNELKIKKRENFSTDSLKNKCELSTSDSSLDYSEDSLVSVVKKDEEISASTESFTFVFLPKKIASEDDSTSPRTLSIDSVYAEFLSQLEVERQNKDAATQTTQQKDIAQLENLKDNSKSKHQLIQLMSDVVSLLKSGHSSCLCNRVCSKSHLKNLIEFRRQMVASTQIRKQKCKIVSQDMISCLSSNGSTDSFVSKIENIRNCDKIHQKWRSDSGAVCPSNISSERLTSPEINQVDVNVEKIQPQDGKQDINFPKIKKFFSAPSSDLEFYDENIFPQDVFMRLPSRLTNGLTYLLYRKKLI